MALLLPLECHTHLMLLIRMSTHLLYILIKIIIVNIWSIFDILNIATCISITVCMAGHLFTSVHFSSVTSGGTQEQLQHCVSLCLIAENFTNILFIWYLTFYVLVQFFIYTFKLPHVPEWSGYMYKNEFNINFKVHL